jgi:hypothetical protein
LDPEPVWMSDEFHTAHLVFCWLSTKLAEWIGASLFRRTADSGSL